MRSSTDRRPPIPEQSIGASLSDGALTPALAARAEALADAKKWREVKQLLLHVDVAELRRHPRTLFIAADAYARLGHADRAVEMAQLAAEEFRARRDEEQYLLAQNLIGAVTLQRGQLADAERTFRLVIAGAEPLGNLDIVGGALNNLGAIASIRGDREEALRCYERALAAFVRTGNEHRLAHTYHNLALAYRDAGLHQEADALFAEVAERARAVGDEWLATVAVTARAEMTLRGEVQDLGAIDAAARQALVRFDVFASTLGQAEAQKLAGMVAASRGDLATAARRLTDAIELAAKHGNPLLVAEARYERGVVRLGLNQVEGAREDLAAAVALFAELGHDEGATRARQRLATAPAAS